MDPESQLHLATVFNRDIGVTMNGVYSIANAVDEALPGGLDASSDAEVKAALSELLADGATDGLAAVPAVDHLDDP